MSYFKGTMSGGVVTQAPEDILDGCYIWGQNNAGEHGLGHMFQTQSPFKKHNATVVQCSLTDSNSAYNVFAEVRSDGTLWLAGGNGDGALGDNTIISKSSPVQTVAGGTNWKYVSTGPRRTAAIKTDSTLWVWGYNLFGVLGDNTVVSKSSPVQTVAAGSNWRNVSIGASHMSAVKIDGTLWSWGANSSGQLGDGTQTAKSSPVQTVAGGTSWQQCSASESFTIAKKSDGTVWAWGDNIYGQLGDNTVAPKSSPVQTVAGGTNWNYVAAGYHNCFGIKTDGTLWLWGQNDYNQLGDGTSVRKSSPVQTIAGGTNWRSVSMNNVTVNAVKTDGTLWGWGSGAFYRLGTSDFTSKSIPIQITAGNNWTHYDAIFSWTIPPKCWPIRVGVVNRETDLIQEQKRTQYVPKEYLIRAYPQLHDQAKMAGLWTWGWNINGQLGDGTTSPKSSPVQTIAGGINWKYVSGMQANYGNMAGIKTDGTLWMWGENIYGSLGDNTISNKSSPTQTIVGGTTWASVSAGGWHTTAIKTDGTLWCWGRNDDGALGDNTVVHKSSPVQTVAGGTTWRQVSAAPGPTSNSTAAIKTDGTLWCWGDNSSGVLGDNTVTKRSSPVQTVAGGTNWKQVSSGIDGRAAIKMDGTLWTWGPNSQGQLGDGTTTSRSSPVQTIAGGTNWKQISVGGNGMAAIKVDGTLWAWGNNSSGKLGDGTTTSRSSPVQTICGGNNWARISFSYAVAALKTDGTLWTWGTNSIGQLGDGSTVASRSSPVQTVAGGTNWKDVVACGNAVAAIRDFNPDF